jgi:hypothetical protein
MMGIKIRNKQDDGTCGEGKYCVQLYSRRAVLVREFCLDAQENNIADMEAAEQLLRHTLTPRDFASTTVTSISDEGLNGQTVLQFDLKPV